MKPIAVSRKTHQIGGVARMWSNLATPQCTTNGGSPLRRTPPQPANLQSAIHNPQLESHPVAPSRTPFSFSLWPFRLFPPNSTSLLPGCLRLAGARADVLYYPRMDVKIKICGLTNVDDALAAVEAGADFLGFVLWERSPRRVTIETAREIARQLPPGVRRAGVFVDAAVEQVMFSLRICDFSALQFHGRESPSFCKQFGVMTIKAFRVRDAASLQAMQGYDTDAFLLDTEVEGQPGGTGKTFDWSLAEGAKQFAKPVFLAGGLTPENVGDALRAVQPFGVDVSSGVESAPGRKDHQKMRDFVAAARAA